MTFYFVSLGNYESPEISTYRIQAENERQAYWLAYVQFVNKTIKDCKTSHQALVDPYNPSPDGGWDQIRDEIFDPAIDPEVVLNDQDMVYGIEQVCKVESLYWTPPEQS